MLILTISLVIFSAVVYLSHPFQNGELLFAATTNQTVNGNMTGIKFLSIQNAQSGSISPINDTAYLLELNNVSDKTILFLIDQIELLRQLVPMIL